MLKVAVLLSPLVLDKRDYAQSLRWWLWMKIVILPNISMPAPIDPYAARVILGSSLHFLLGDIHKASPIGNSFGSSYPLASPLLGGPLLALPRAIITPGSIA